MVGDRGVGQSVGLNSGLGFSEPIGDALTGERKFVSSSYHILAYCIFSSICILTVACDPAHV